MVIVDLFRILCNQLLLVGIMQSCVAPSFLCGVTQFGSSVMSQTDRLVVCVPAETSRVMRLIKLKLNINFRWAQVYQRN
jgi:hypothetical protein